jgi:hypothetical protein
MAQKTREQLNTANAALFVNNTTGDITPAEEKAYNEDVNDSFVIRGEGYFKVELTQPQIFGGATVDIPECPELPAGFAWVVNNAQVKYTFGTEPYDNVQVSVQPETGRPPFGSGNAIKDASESFFAPMIRNDCEALDSMIIESKKLQVLITSESTTGDGTAIIYGQAILLSL